MQEHAHLLGGDASNVTIFGESAGGASVVALLAMRASEGLFDRAIVQSASFSQLRERGRADLAAKELLTAAGLDVADIDRLRELPLEQLVGSQQGLLRDPMAWFTAFSPVADGVVLPDTLDGLLAAAARRAVPVVVGTTRDEMQLFTALDPIYLHLDDAGLLERAAAVLGEAAPSALAAYRAARPGARPASSPRPSPPTTGSGCRPSASPSRGWRPGSRRGCTGSPGRHRPSAVSSVRATASSCRSCSGTCTNPASRSSRAARPTAPSWPTSCSHAWLAMARRGDPGWVPYDLEERPTMRFDLPSGVVSDPEANLRLLWDSVG